MGKVKVRIPRHRLTVVTGDNRSVTSDNSVTTAVTWMWNCLKTAFKRMKRVLAILLLGLLATSVLSHILDYDPPLPPPEPDQIATILSVETLPREDTVSAIERELESELGQSRGHQIPLQSRFSPHVQEVARIVAVHVKDFKE